MSHLCIIVLFIRKVDFEIWDPIRRFWRFLPRIFRCSAFCKENFPLQSKWVFSASYHVAWFLSLKGGGSASVDFGWRWSQVRWMIVGQTQLDYYGLLRLKPCWVLSPGYRINPYPRNNTDIRYIFYRFNKAVLTKWPYAVANQLVCIGKILPLVRAENVFAASGFVRQF